MKDQKGFTLIELLMVIAIIGVLAAIVLVNVGAARDKSADAVVKANLVNIRSQTEVYYSTNINYGGETASCNSGIFSGDPSIEMAIASAEEASGGSAVCSSSDGAVGTGGNALSWAITVPLKSPSGSGFWCVDFEGLSKETSVLVPADINTTEVSQCP
ncbi:MAG: type II secretion system protein [Candidatus Pacebacteria bacterium]|nr:type II secretion system protein [Candidatus Paceibacterota bacterium]